MNSVCPNTSFMHLPEEMTHNDFELVDDLVVPFRDFIVKIDEPILFEQEQKRKKGLDNNEESNKKPSIT